MLPIESSVGILASTTRISVVVTILCLLVLPQQGVVSYCDPAVERHCHDFVETNITSTGVGLPSSITPVVDDDGPMFDDDGFDEYDDDFDDDLFFVEVASPASATQCNTLTMKVTTVQLSLPQHPNPTDGEDVADTDDDERETIDSSNTNIDDDGGISAGPIVGIATAALVVAVVVAQITRKHKNRSSGGDDDVAADNAV